MTTTDTFRLLPDVQQLVANFLRSQTEMTALVSDRVWTIIPGDRTYPFLLVTQVADAPMTTRPWWGVVADLQLQAYAVTTKPAHTVVETARSLLAQRAMTQHAEGTVSWVTFANLSFVPDAGVLTTQGRPMPRWITTASITAHPNPT